MHFSRSKSSTVNLSPFTPSATVRDMARDLAMSEQAIGEQLGMLYAKFDVAEGPDRLAQLANDALSCGAIRLADLRSMRETP